MLAQLEQSSLADLLDRVAVAVEAWREQRKKDEATEALVGRIATLFGYSVDEARKRLSGPTIPPPTSPPPERDPESVPVERSGLRFSPDHPMPKSFPRSGLLSALQRQTNPQSVFLPVVPGAGLAPGSAPSAAQATAAAASLVAIAHHHVANTTMATSAMADLLSDSAALAGTQPTPVGKALNQAVLALMLVSATSLRSSSAGKRLVTKLIRAASPETVDEVAFEVARRVAGEPGTPIALSAALRAGLTDLLIEFCQRLEDRSVLRGRLFGEDLAIAVMSYDDEDGLRSQAFQAAGVGDDVFEQVESWLVGFSKRRRRPQPALDHELPP